MTHCSYPSKNSKFSVKIFKFSLPRQQGLVWDKFRRPRKPPDWCKNQEHISHRSPVTANFLLKISKFGYHGNRRWSETNFTYTVKFTDPKNPQLVQESGKYLPYKSSYSKFSVTIFKFSLPWEQGLVWDKFHLHS